MTSLQSFLKDADERVREAAAKALNEAAEEMKKQIVSNMAARGIESRTGNLVGSVKFSHATAKRPSVKIVSEVFNTRLPKKPGARNPRMAGRYPSQGVPYGRILEFSPKFRKYNGFFYKAWYDKRKAIRERVIAEIGNAWSGK